MLSAQSSHLPEGTLTVVVGRKFRANNKAWWLYENQAARVFTALRIAWPCSSAVFRPAENQAPLISKARSFKGLDRQLRALVHDRDIAGVTVNPVALLSGKFMDNTKACQPF